MDDGRQAGSRDPWSIVYGPRSVFKQNKKPLVHNKDERQASRGTTLINEPGDLRACSFTHWRCNGRARNELGGINRRRVPIADISTAYPCFVRPAPRRRSAFAAVAGLQPVTRLLYQCALPTLPVRRCYKSSVGIVQSPTGACQPTIVELINRLQTDVDLPRIGTCTGLCKQVLCT